MAASSLAGVESMGPMQARKCAQHPGTETKALQPRTIQGVPNQIRSKSRRKGSLSRRVLTGHVALGVVHELVPADEARIRELGQVLIEKQQIELRCWSKSAPPVLREQVQTASRRRRISPRARTKLQARKQHAGCMAGASSATKCAEGYRFSEAGHARNKTSD